MLVCSLLQQEQRYAAYSIILLFKNEDINLRFISHISAKNRDCIYGGLGKPEEFYYQDYSIISGDKEAAGFANVPFKVGGEILEGNSVKFY